MIEAPLPPNSSFSTKLLTLQLAYDSTSLGELKFCAQKYKYVIIDGFEPIETNVHLRFGIEFGAATEVYDRARVAGLNSEAALAEAVRYALTSTWDEQLSRPWVSGDETKNRENLIRAIVDYADNFREDSLETLQLPDGSAAAELSFSFEIPGMEPASTGEKFLFCGYLDRVVTWQGKIWITDRKTTGKPLNRAYFARYSPDNQVSFYALAGRIIFDTEVSGVIIDATQVTKTGTSFQRGIIERSEPQLVEWLREASFYIGLAELFATRNEWPHNDKACLAGTALVSVTRGTNKGKKLSIRELYNLFHKEPSSRIHRNRPELLGRKREKFTKYGLDTYILSDVGGIVENNLVLDIIYQGRKPVYFIETSAGTTTRATGDHEFKTAEGVWVKVEDLHEGDSLAFWNGRRRNSTITPPSNVNRAYVTNVPYYGGGGWEKIEHGYTVLCQRTSRLVVEASMNGLDYQTFLSIIRTDEESAGNLIYLEPDVEVHHKNGDPADDSLSNLEALSMSGHKERHDMRENVNKLGVATIIKMFLQSTTDVYDISMQAPHNNFIVDGLVAHNCGATYLDPKTGEITYGCPFRPVCASDPNIRPELLRLNYRRRVWDPLKLREAKRNPAKLKQELELT